jgi:antitoxin (DNA-binding transcriptional repressor) of toxin-antitoxin stability system
MEVFTVQEFQENFDNLIERVENGERIGIVNDDGSAAVMIPANDNVYQMYTDYNNEAP